MDWSDCRDEVDKLGIAENTVIVVMGDNGPFLQYAGPTGQSDRIYRGGKTDHLEGGVRVNAWVKWEGVIEAGSYAEDMIHVSDLYTTFSRLANATDGIPRDKIIDGLDQSGVLLMGETHGRRDYLHIYEGTELKSVVKNKYRDLIWLLQAPTPSQVQIFRSLPRSERVTSYRFDQNRSMGWRPVRQHDPTSYGVKEEKVPEQAADAWNAL